MGKILVTGGAGFLGSHLCDALIKEGNQVICVDNFLSGRRENLAHLTGNPSFELIEHDVTLPLPQVSGLKLDAIFHFASPASPNPASSTSYLAHPVETLMVNSLGTKNMLELATSNSCQIILASSSEIYGDPAVHPQPESYWGHVSPHGPRSCYDEGKRFLEAISFAYHRTKQTKIKLLRIFNTYGPRMDLSEGRLIPELVKAALSDSTFTLYGDGTATRSFCYVDDLIKGILAAHASDQMIGQVVNLGNDQEFTVNQAIKLMAKLSGGPLNLKQEDPLTDDPARRRPDLTRAKKILAWQPSIPLEKGLKLMLDSYGQEK